PNSCGQWKQPDSMRFAPPRPPRPPRLRLTRSPLEAHTEPRSFFSRGDAESAELLPGRAAFGATPNLPRPDQRPCCMWFLPVGSRLNPPRYLPGEADSTPRTLTRPERTTTSKDP